MKTIHISLLRNNSILRLYTQRNLIQTDPEYQRMGEIWTLEKKQLLIDSILNDFDIPKIYFHEFLQPKEMPDGRKVDYAIIDGRQRLECVWSFINNGFALSKDFEYYKDKKVKAQELTYKELANKYPDLKSIFDSFSLPIMSVLTDDIDLIEEMFSRLNEAVPLNAAEKRNAIGGNMTLVIRRVAEHDFFNKNIPFSNTRYKFREIACKMLYMTFNQKILDTSKVNLDLFVKHFKPKTKNKEALGIEKKTSDILDMLNKLFINRDSLLRGQGTIVIYYLLAKRAYEEDWDGNLNRKKLLQFNNERQENKRLAEKDITKANFELLEFDRVSYQGTNDAASMRFRFDVLVEYLQR